MSELWLGSCKSIFELPVGYIAMCVWFHGLRVICLTYHGISRELITVRLVSLYPIQQLRLMLFLQQNFAEAWYLLGVVEMSFKIILSLTRLYANKFEFRPCCNLIFRLVQNKTGEHDISLKKALSHICLYECVYAL